MELLRDSRTWAETLSDMKLRILTVPRAKTVNYSAKEVDAQQRNSEEQQPAF